jgi:hypothetical protein
MDSAPLPVDLWPVTEANVLRLVCANANMTVIDYKGYRIEVCSVGKGWRASIFSPGSTTPWPNSPVNLEKSSTEEIVAEAKRVIEVRLGPRFL